MADLAIFVIVPAYNEARALRQTLAPLIAAGYRVVVVDDGSTDETAQVLERLSVTVVRHAVNLGQGAALQTGMDYALRNGAVIAVHFDADGQHPFDAIPSLVGPILRGEADVVLGSRFLRLEDAARTPRARRLLLRVGIVISGLFTAMWLSDTHNGFRAFSRKALAEIQIREDGFAHATEILAGIRRKKLRYVEVPSAIRYSEYSRGKGQPFWNAFNILIDLLLERVSSKLRSKLWNRAIVVLLFAASMLAGLGGGVEQFVYVAIPGLAFGLLLLLAHGREIERRSTLLVRELALLQAKGLVTIPGRFADRNRAKR
jgi:polyprenyl-phospho-N-acetylgalactosaminyl synthase